MLRSFLILATRFVCFPGHSPRATAIIASALGSVTAWHLPAYSQEPEKALPSETKIIQDATADEKGWKSFFGKDNLEGWEVTDFYKPGKVLREGELTIFEVGSPLTGITYRRDQGFPTSNFEIQLEARRTDGNDFLCGLTFPVGKEFCTFIAGGWGGGLVGLSSIDGADASENSTSSHHDFKNGQWYKFRVIVEDDVIRCWIGDEECISQERENHKFSTRIEVYPSQPLGLCVFESRVEIKNFRWRSVGQEPMDEKTDDQKRK